MESSCMFDISWWRHQMASFSALLSFCTGNSSVTGKIKSLTKANDAELWRHRPHCDVIVMLWTDWNKPICPNKLEIDLYMAHELIDGDSSPSGAPGVITKFQINRASYNSIVQGGPLSQIYSRIRRLNPCNAMGALWLWVLSKTRTC